MKRLWSLLFLATGIIHAGAITESVQYNSQPVPVWADFTVQASQLLSFSFSDTTGSFTIAIPGLPAGAILDTGTIELLSGSGATGLAAMAAASESVSGGFTWTAVAQYNGATAALGSYVGGPYSVLDYAGAGTLTAAWDLTYGWPGTDLTVSGNNPQVTTIQESANIAFWVQADITATYHFGSTAVPEPATFAIMLAGFVLVMRARVRDVVGARQRKQVPATSGS